MAQKAKKWEEWLELVGETANVVSYADYFARRPLFLSLRIKNTSDEAVGGLTLTIENGNGMLVPYERELDEIPYESMVKIEPENLLSPLYFSTLEESRQENSRKFGFN